MKNKQETEETPNDEAVFASSSNDLLDAPSVLEPLSQPPNAGDIVYHENRGLVMYRVRKDYSGRHKAEYPELVLLEVVHDFGNGYFKSGHLSLRDLSVLQKSI